MDKRCLLVNVGSAYSGDETCVSTLVLMEVLENPIYTLISMNGCESKGQRMYPIS